MADLMDPTYDREEIDANPIWKLAFHLSELKNDDAPIGWSRYMGDANKIHSKCKRKSFNALMSAMEVNGSTAVKASHVIDTIIAGKIPHVTFNTLK